MIAILTLAIITIIIVSVTSYQGYQNIQSLNLAFKGQTLVEELLMTKKQILAYSTILDDMPVLPYGTNGPKYHTLPINILKKKNVFGGTYVYCPFSPIGNTNYSNNVVLADGSAYNVTNQEIEVKRITQPYVIASDQNQFNDIGVQAIIISPTQPFTSSISCQDVVYNSQTDSFLVDGGRVEVITSSEIQAVNMH